jgi:hypothetical protein
MSFDQSKKNEQVGNVADAAKAGINKTTEHSEQIMDAARNGLNKAVDLHEQAAESTKQLLQKGVETASHQAREATDRFTRTLGFSGQDSERLARQSKQDMEAVTRCGTVLTQAFQDASRNWLELGQKQWKRNLDGLNKLARAQSVQEFTAIQSGLIRESLQHMVQDSRTIAETSVRAVDEAGKTFSGLAQQVPSQAR